MLDILLPLIEFKIQNGADFNWDNLYGIIHVF